MAKKNKGSVKDFGSNVKKLKEEENKNPVASQPDEPELVYRTEDEATPKSTSSFQKWAIGSDGDQFMPIGATSPIIEAGVYNCGLTNEGKAVFAKQPINVDSLLAFKDSVSSEVLAEIDKFWSLEKNFSKHGFLHRRGFLLYGPPGSGKSALIQQVISNVVERNYIVALASNPAHFTEALAQFRKVEPKRKLICLFEDIDAYIRRYDEDKVLSLLDGENQLDNVLNIATTNYPENLDPRIVNRPRRFDNLVFIGMPNDSIRKEYFTKKLGLESKEVDKWVKDSDGFSFAALAEAVISIKCLGNTYKDTFDKLKQLQSQNLNSENWGGSRLGFNK